MSPSLKYGHMASAACKLLQRGPVRSPGRKRILTHLKFSKRIWWQRIFNISAGFEPTIRHQKIPRVRFLLPPQTYSRKHPASTCRWSGRPCPCRTYIVSCRATGHFVMPYYNIIIICYIHNLIQILNRISTFIQ